MARIAANAPIVTLCLLIGCTADSGDDPAAGADSAIVAGTNDEGHASVALIRYVRTDSAGVEHKEWCTGSLVAADIVLTAAHCVAPRGSHNKGWTVSFSATTKNGEMIDPIAVTKAIPHPNFDDNFGPFDVAVLFLEHAPAHLQPMPIVETLGDVVGHEMTFIGYGATDASDDGSKLIGGNDRRRKVTVKVSAMSETFLEYKGDKGLCPGDSGGPTLMTIDGVESIVALNDLASPGCKTNGASLRIDDTAPWRAFLAEHIPGVSAPHGDADDGDAGAP
jgi:secreted trypsin-like serine protease